MAKKNIVHSEYLYANFGLIIEGGWVSAPVVFLAHYAECGISDKAAMFILQILRARHESKTKIISDTDLKMESSEKTIYRIRKDLKDIKDDKGNNLIIIKSFYSKDDKGHVIGAGTAYDFSRLFDYMYFKFPPSGQNDGSGMPDGLYERTDGQNDRSDNARGQIVSLLDPNSNAEGQIGQSSPDKMTDTIIDKEFIEIKNMHSNSKLLFSWEEWEFLDNSIARNIITGKEYSVHRLPFSVPDEVCKKIDEMYPLY